MNACPAVYPVTHNPRFETPRAAYIHVPFCRHRCGYCNFTLIAGRDDLIDSYVQALALELSWLQHPRPVESLYVGGGTPSHLPLRQQEHLLALLPHWFPPAGSYEFTLEANPSDVTDELLDTWQRAGVNRVSLGIQSFQAEKLAVLERDHGRTEIRRAVEGVHGAIGNLAIDLMFGVPGETLAAWCHDLQAALFQQPQHISVYGLTIERGSRYYGLVRRGVLPALSENLERDMYVQAMETLIAAGYEHYEVSNFALPGYRSRHNETYWMGRGYYAAGPGASRYVAGRRETNHRSVVGYLRRVLGGTSPVAESEYLAPEDAARERLVFGLRRLEGLDKPRFLDETGFDVDSLGGDALQRFSALGLLENTGQHLRLTRAGLLISDALWPELLRR
jgi:oxygen-independent coproporphyrinogen-3 oxidase